MKRKSIKRTVFIRVAAALLSILLFSGVTTFNLLRIKGMQEENTKTQAVLSQAQMAEAAHYRWALTLSNALYAEGEFPGTDDTKCVLGQWLYGEAGTGDKAILDLRNEIQPLHKKLHQSVGEAKTLMETSHVLAQEYYQDTLQSNLTTLVGKLDQVIERAQALSTESSDGMRSTIMVMQVITGVCLVLALFCLISLVLYVLKRVLAPILHITRQVQPLQEGSLDLALENPGNNELGDLSTTLEKAISGI